MNLKQKLFGISLATFFVISVGLGISQATESSVPGVYLLIEVNGKKLPAISWTKKLDGEFCKIETIGGALLLDSEGRWTTLVTERNLCLHEDGSETADKEASIMFAGSYKVSGNQITLQDENSADEAILNGDLLVITVIGVGVYEGQTTKYVLRRE